MDGQQDALRYRRDMNHRKSNKDSTPHSAPQKFSLAAPLPPFTDSLLYECCNQRLQALEARISLLECHITVPDLLAVGNNQTTSAVDVSMPPYFNDGGNSGLASQPLHHTGYSFNTSTSGQYEPGQLRPLQLIPGMQHGEGFDDARGHNLEPQDSPSLCGSGFGSGSGPNDLGMNALGYPYNLQGTNHDVVSSLQTPFDNSFSSPLLVEDLSEPNNQRNTSIPNAMFSPASPAHQSLLSTDASSSHGSTATTRFHCTFPNCHGSFGRKGDRDRHGRRHGARQFRCSFPGCVRGGMNGFWRKDKFTEHLRTHQQP